MIYHVAREYNGYDLMSLLTQVERGLISQEDAIGAVIEAWPDIYIGYDADSDEARELAWEYILTGDGCEVHCHATLEEAKAYRAEFAPAAKSL